MPFSIRFHLLHLWCTRFDCVIESNREEGKRYGRPVWSNTWPSGQETGTVWTCNREENLPMKANVLLLESGRSDSRGNTRGYVAKCWPFCMKYRNLFDLLLELFGHVFRQTTWPFPIDAALGEPEKRFANLSNPFHLNWHKNVEVSKSAVSILKESESQKCREKLFFGPRKIW